MMVVLELFGPVGFHHHLENFSTLINEDLMLGLEKNCASSFCLS